MTRLSTVRPSPPLPARRRRRFAALVAVAALIAAACSSVAAGPESTTTTQADPEPPGLHFVDVAGEVGLDFRHGAFRWAVSADPAAMMGGGVCWIDADGDGWLDLFLVNTYSLDEWDQWNAGPGVPTSALFRNVGGSFEDMTASAGVDVPVRGNGCVAADLDLDGHTDLYVTTDRANVLFWNDGDGTFTEGAEAAGVDAYGWQTGAAVGDLDGDGWPDLVVAGYADLNNPKPGSSSGFPGSHFGRRDLLYLSGGAGEPRRFVEVGEQAGLDVLDGGEHEYGLGAVLTDLDGDGDLDLYVANDTNPNRVYANEPIPGGAEADPGGLGFRLREVTDFSPEGDDNSGMGVAPGDPNGDGLTDLVVTNLNYQLHSLYLNTTVSGQPIELEDGRARLGLPDLGEGYTGWGATWADLDHDTHVDLLVVNGDLPITDLGADAQPAVLYAAVPVEEGVRLADATAAVGLAAVGPLDARGSAAADYDNDGDLDIAINQVGGPAVLLENRGVGDGWLTVVTDSPAARVRITLPDGRTLHRSLHAGSSYLSSEDPRAHFGLSDAGRVAEVTVTWSDGTTTSLMDVAARQIVTVAR